MELVTVVTMAGNYERTMQRARAIVQRVQLRAPVVISDAELRDIYHVDHVPWTVLIDRQGKAVEVVRGAENADFFRGLVTRYL